MIQPEKHTRFMKAALEEAKKLSKNRKYL